MPAVMLSNTSPMTTLISFGGVVVAIILYLAPSPKSGQIIEQEMEPEENHRVASTA
jgi:hypothetical protein